MKRQEEDTNAFVRITAVLTKKQHGIGRRHFTILHSALTEVPNLDPGSVTHKNNLLDSGILSTDNSKI